jgi:hypothetical protein
MTSSLKEAGRGWDIFQNVVASCVVDRGCRAQASVIRYLVDFKGCIKRPQSNVDTVPYTLEEGENQFIG